MPLCRYLIGNEYELADPELYGVVDQDDPEALLESMAMFGLIGILRQLGDLTQFAAEIFHELHEEVVATATRGRALIARVQQLETEFPSVEKKLLSQTTHIPLPYGSGGEWHPRTGISENLITQVDMPGFLMDSYEECRGPPRLFLLDKYDIAGAGACLTRYTDPSVCKTESDVSLKVKMRRPRRGNQDTQVVFPSPRAKLHQLLLEDRIQSGQSDPQRLAKLKKRPLGIFSHDERPGRSYMQKILASSPEHKVVEDTSLELVPTIDESNTNSHSGLEAGNGSPSPELDQGNETKYSSPSMLKAVIKSQVCESNEVIAGSIMEMPGAINDYDTDKLLLLLNEKINDKELTADANCKSEGFAGEYFSEDGHCKSEGFVEGYFSEDGASEFDDYVNAFAAKPAMESEVDPVCRTKGGPSYQTKGENMTESNGRQPDLRNVFSDDQGGNSDEHIARGASSDPRKTSLEEAETNELSSNSFKIGLIFISKKWMEESDNVPQGALLENVSDGGDYQHLPAGSLYGGEEGSPCSDTPLEEPKQNKRQQLKANCFNAFPLPNKSPISVLDHPKPIYLMSKYGTQMPKTKETLEYQTSFSAEPDTEEQDDPISQTTDSLPPLLLSLEGDATPCSRDERIDSFVSNACGAELSESIVSVAVNEDRMVQSRIPEYDNDEDLNTSVIEHTETPCRVEEIQRPSEPPSLGKYWVTGSFEVDASETGDANSVDESGDYTLPGSGGETACDMSGGLDVYEILHPTVTSQVHSQAEPISETTNTLAHFEEQSDADPCPASEKGANVEDIDIPMSFDECESDSNVEVVGDNNACFFTYTAQCSPESITGTYSHEVDDESLRAEIQSERYSFFPELNCDTTLHQNGINQTSSFQRSLVLDLQNHVDHIKDGLANGGEFTNEPFTEGVSGALDCSEQSVPPKGDWKDIRTYTSISGLNTGLSQSLEVDFSVLAEDHNQVSQYSVCSSVGLHDENQAILQDENPGSNLGLPMFSNPPDSTKSKTGEIPTLPPLPPMQWRVGRNPQTFLPSEGLFQHPSGFVKPFSPSDNDDDADVRSKKKMESQYPNPFLSSSAEYERDKHTPGFLGNYEEQPINMVRVDYARQIINVDQSEDLQSQSNTEMDGCNLEVEVIREQMTAASEHPEHFLSSTMPKPSSLNKQPDPTTVAAQQESPSPSVKYKCSKAVQYHHQLPRGLFALETRDMWSTNTHGESATKHENPNDILPRKIPRPRNPLIDAVVAVDKSKLRKVADRAKLQHGPTAKSITQCLPLLRKAEKRAKPEEGEKHEEREQDLPPLRKIGQRLKAEDRDLLLEQIRNQSFNLKPAAMPGPSNQAQQTSLNVAVILEKANIIRQAMAGSDEDDSDAWSDN